MCQQRYKIYYTLHSDDLIFRFQLPNSSVQLKQEVIPSWSASSSVKTNSDHILYKYIDRY